MFNTEVLKIKDSLIEDNAIDKIAETTAIKKAAQYILNNEVVAFPTETVYGLGANALEKQAVTKIFKAKGRPSDNPLIAHISDKNQLPVLIEGDVSGVAEELINEFWPGPLTLIFNKSMKMPQVTTAGLNTIAVRMPSHPVALALISKVNLPLAAPSANSSGFPSPTRAQHVYNDLNGKIPLIVDGGICNIGVESTVIEIEENIINILRPGGITRSMISEVIGDAYQVKIADTAEVNKPKSPGMKYKHYAPQTPLWIFKSKNILVNLLSEYNINNENTLVILSDESLNNVDENDIQANIKNMGTINNLEYIAQNLFNFLREADQKGYDLILIEEVPNKDIGEAVMNRLKKAAVKII
ncbi:MAG: threonylcarbamoyl-AMP synthase [Halanaerobiales bacterium]|nr:threonylcarbamoyl-AMP synthase [Halanaerobiales bacterium]